MRQRYRTLFQLLLPLSLAAACAPHEEPATPSPGEAASSELAQIADEYWQHQLDESLLLRLRHGLPLERLPDLSHEGAAERARFAAALLDRLDRLDRLDHEGLTDADWLTWQILAWETRQRVEGLEHFWLLFQVTPYTWSGLGVLQAFRGFPFERVADLDGYLALARQLPELAAQLRSNLEQQRSRGILLPRPQLDPVAAVFEALGAGAAASPFSVAGARLDGLDSDAAEAFEAELARLIDEEVAPAFRSVAAVFDEGYRDEAPETVGISQYPGGEQAYRYLVGLHTSTDLTPEAIHRRGRAEVDRIAARMDELREEIAPELDRQALHDRLRSDPRFFADTPEEVEARLMEPIRRIEPHVERYFLHTPEAPYGVERLERELEATMTYGYYRRPTPEEPVGVYKYNGSRLEERSLVNAAALIYHELVPGHHFQIALQNEETSLPDFRRESMHTAFVEGWAEYASELAGEMGLYEDPYDLYGRLAMDMFLSVRLVVDTGMNAMGWSLEEARETMRRHVLETETQIETESLRYATDMPGQALAYKIGSATFKQLREAAQRELGPHFDIRRFHEAVLTQGSMPLEVLEAYLARVEHGARPERAAAATGDGDDP